MEIERVSGKKMFAKKVNKRCDGNEDWHGLQNKLLDVAT